jgi:hypothetical protein
MSSNIVILNWTAELEETYEKDSWGDTRDIQHVVIKIGDTDVARKSDVYVDTWGDGGNTISDVAGELLSEFFAKLTTRTQNDQERSL